MIVINGNNCSSLQMVNTRRNFNPNVNVPDGGGDRGMESGVRGNNQVPVATPTLTLDAASIAMFKAMFQQMLQEAMPEIVANPPNATEAVPAVNLGVDHARVHGDASEFSKSLKLFLSLSSLRPSTALESLLAPITGSPI